MRWIGQLAMIISYPISASGIIVFLKCHFDEIFDIHFFTFSYTIGLS